MRIVFMGTPTAAAVSLQALIDAGHDIAAVYTQPDRPSGRGNKITMSPVKELAMANKIEVLQPEKVRTQEAAERFSSFKANVAVVVAYGRILPNAFLTAFPYGAINVHFSLLPKYRGAAPVNWAIVNGETESGVTTMKMDEGLDTGDILEQMSTPIGAKETAVELMERLGKIGAELLLSTLGKLDGLVPVVQNHSDATLAPIMKKSDGLIDWSMSAADIERRIRGFQPFPSSHSTLDGQRVVFYTADAEASDSTESCGTILEARSRLVVKCGFDSQLVIDDLQIEGKRRMSARDVLNSGKILVGQRFGE